MRRRLLDFLACPDCQGESLELEIYSADTYGDSSELEVEEGVVNCKSCHRQYPIIEGIPRMIPHTLLGYVLERFDEFCAKYPSLNLRPNNYEETLKPDVIATLKAYTYEHVNLQDSVSQVTSKRHQQHFEDHCLVPRSFMKGKVGLDVGCGEGRHIYNASKQGAAEMVGVDLSGGVEVARNNNRGNPKTHFVQGDIYNLPFKREIFDFIYSIGVLHHTPDPKRSFLEVSTRLAPDGFISVWLYSLEKDMTFWYRMSHMKMLRGLFHKCPQFMKLALSAVIASGLQVFVWLPCVCLSRIDGLGKALDEKAIINNYRRPFKSKVRTVFDRFQAPVTYYITQHQVKQWYAEAHLTALEIRPRDGKGIIAIGNKEKHLGDQL